MKKRPGGHCIRIFIFSFLKHSHSACVRKKSWQWCIMPTLSPVSASDSVKLPEVRSQLGTQTCYKLHIQMGPHKRRLHKPDRPKLAEKGLNIRQKWALIASWKWTTSKRRSSGCAILLNVAHACLLPFSLYCWQVTYLRQILYVIIHVVPALHRATRCRVNNIEYRWMDLLNSNES